MITKTTFHIRENVYNDGLKYYEVFRKDFVKRTYLWFIHVTHEITEKVVFFRRTREDCIEWIKEQERCIKKELDVSSLVSQKFIS